MGYFRAGFDVTGVDITPQPNYPFTFIQADALQYIADNGHLFDAIHASPPCQKYSMIQRANRNKDKWPDLIDPVRQLLIASGLPYVIENVEGAPLRIDLRLCGSMFQLGMIRHRIFESSIPLIPILSVCDHSNMYDPWHKDGVDQLRQMSKGMKIDWMKRREEVREAIPPAFTEYIGRQLREAITC